MTGPNPLRSSRRGPRVGRCEAYGTTRQLDRRSWDQDLTSSPRGDRGQQDAAL